MSHEAEEEVLSLSEEQEIQYDLPKQLKTSTGKRTRAKVDDDESFEQDIHNPDELVDLLPDSKEQLMELEADVTNRLTMLKRTFVSEQDSLATAKSFVGDNCIPICADVTSYDFDRLLSTQLEVGGRDFDVILMDPPWKLSTANPLRGVAIQYDSLSDEAIEKLPVPKLQNAGFLCIWAINAKFQFTVNLMEKKWGYKIVDIINWVKKTVNGNIAKGHGFYLQHGKQSCIIGFKSPYDNYVSNVASDVIFSERRGQSQKPTEIYGFIQKLVPNGFYLEIFGRRNNLRNGWVTIGNEL